MIDFDKLSVYKEHNRLEAKKAVGGLPNSIWETYSAFANGHTGEATQGTVPCVHVKRDIIFKDHTRNRPLCDLPCVIGPLCYRE